MFTSSLQGILQNHSLETIMWDSDDPCSVNTAYDPESSFTMSPRSMTRPLYFWYWGSTRFRPMLISSLLRHQQNQKLEIIPIYIVVLCFPHDNIVCTHMCDECMKSIDSGVCHRPWSMLWLIVQAYLLTIEYHVVQFLPSISILEQFESIHVTILQQISTRMYCVGWNVVSVSWNDIGVLDWDGVMHGWLDKCRRVSP